MFYFALLFVGVFGFVGLAFVGKELNNKVEK